MDIRSLYNQGQPQDLLSLHYTGVLTSNFSVEGQWAQRNYDLRRRRRADPVLIEGTLLIDRARGGTNFRYWSPTFCGVCDNNEKRNNTDVLVKGSYFLSTRGTGSQHLVFGYDSYNDHRFDEQPPVRQRLPHPRDVDRRSGRGHHSGVSAAARPSSSGIQSR